MLAFALSLVTVLAVVCIGLAQAAPMTTTTAAATRTTTESTKLHHELSPSRSSNNDTRAGSPNQTRGPASHLHQVNQNWSQSAPQWPPTQTQSSENSSERQLTLDQRTKPQTKPQHDAPRTAPHRHQTTPPVEPIQPRAGRTYPPPSPNQLDYAANDTTNTISQNNQQQQTQTQTEPNSDPNQSTPFVFYDTPYTRRQLAKYILTEFHESDLNSVLDHSPALIEASRKEVFGQVVSEALVEAGATNLTGVVTLINGSQAPALPRPYYGEAFESFRIVYWPIHCVICLVICTLGILANLINVIVLTRPNMRSAVNTILCAIAYSDLIVNISYIPYLMHELADNTNESDYYSKPWSYYILIHAHVTVTAHTISIWLTCALATWRYCVIRSQTSNKRNWSSELAKRVIFCVVFLVPVFCIPNYLSFAIVSETTEKNSTIYKVGFSALADDSQFIKTFHFWIFSCLTKLLPCLMLTCFTSILIRLLSQARERRMRLTNNFARNSNGAPPEAKTSIPNGHLKLAHRLRMASEDPGVPRRASDDDDLDGRRRLGKSGQAANGLMPRQALLTSGDSQDTGQSRDGGDNLGDGSGSGSCESRNDQFAGHTGEENLQLLAKDMSMQRNVLVIKETGAKCQPGHHDEIGGQRLGACKSRSGEMKHHQAGQGSDDLEGSSEPRGAHLHLHNHRDRDHHHQDHNDLHHRLTTSKGSCDIVNMTAANNGLANNGDSNNKSNNLACYITAHSGSSCATDAECMAVSASESSETMAGSNTIDHAVQHQQQQQPSRPQLLVETTATNMQAASTTTRTLMLTNNDRANLIGDNSNNKQLDQCQASMAHRSASTGGALELYAINNRGGAQSRLTMANVAQAQANLAQNDVYPPMGRANKMGMTNRSGSAASQSSTTNNNNGMLPENGHGPELRSANATTTALDHANRPRSIGSASFAPLQIVRFQATHRQLSQNETTTRLLIAVIIVFLICEFPAGILAALCAILGQEFFDNVYQPMGTLTDLLALINSSVNFILYCCMSTQFRVTFYRVVLHCPAPRDINSHK